MLELSSMLNLCKNFLIWEMVNFKVGLLMRLLEHGTISDKLMHFHIAFSNYLITFWILYRSGSVWNLHGR